MAVGLIHGHLYTYQDIYLLLAYAPAEEPDLWLLVRLDRETGQVIASPPGTTVGFMGDTASGEWHEVSRALPSQVERKWVFMDVTWPLELVHMGESLADVDLIDLLRDLVL